MTSLPNEQLIKDLEDEIEAKLNSHAAMVVALNVIRQQVPCFDDIVSGKIQIPKLEEQINDPVAELPPGAFLNALNIAHHAGQHASLNQRIELLQALIPDRDELLTALGGSQVNEWRDCTVWLFGEDA